jgi:hypothetical protein
MQKSIAGILAVIVVVALVVIGIQLNRSPPDPECAT